MLNQHQQNTEKASNTLASSIYLVIKHVSQFAIVTEACDFSVPNRLIAAFFQYTTW